MNTIEVVIFAVGIIVGVGGFTTFTVLYLLTNKQLKREDKKKRSLKNAILVGWSMCFSFLIAGIMIGAGELTGKTAYFVIAILFIIPMFIIMFKLDKYLDKNIKA